MKRAAGILRGLGVVAAVLMQFGVLQGQTPACTPLPAAYDTNTDPGFTPVMAADRRAATLHIQRGEYAEATASAQAMIQESPSSSAAFDTLGGVYLHHSEMKLAIAAFNRALTLNPCNALVHYHVAHLYRIAGDAAQSQQQLDLAHNLAPNDPHFTHEWNASQQLAAAAAAAPGPTAVSALRPWRYAFFAKSVDCDGIPVRSSSVVDDSALLQTCEKVRKELANIPVVRQNLVAMGAELHVIGQDEALSDLPEHRDQRAEPYVDNLGKLTDLDLRARGEGGLYSSCDEENILQMPGNGYGKYDVCTHEFAHNIMNNGLGGAEQQDIEKVYKASLHRGLWKGAYAATNANEFWADLSLCYFGETCDNAPHQTLDGPAALRAYDPAAFALLDNIYSGRRKTQPILVTQATRVSPSERSGESSLPGTLLLVNNTRRRFFTFWVGQYGVVQPVGRLEPYNRLVQPTEIGRVWVVQDEFGKSVIRFKLTGAVSVGTIDDRDLQ